MKPFAKATHKRLSCFCAQVLWRPSVGQIYLVYTWLMKLASRCSMCSLSSTTFPCDSTFKWPAEVQQDKLSFVCLQGAAAEHPGWQQAHPHGYTGAPAAPQQYTQAPYRMHAWGQPPAYVPQGCALQPDAVIPHHESLCAQKH